MMSIIAFALVCACCITLSLSLNPSSVHISGTPVLKASPPILTSTSRTVTVSWSGITNPSTKDFLAIYSPAAGADTQDYMGWVYLSSSSSYTQGFGEITIPNMVNMRTDYVFKVFTCGSITPAECNSTNMQTVLSNVVAFDAPLAPSQPHLALTASPDQMSLMWVSGDNASQPTVQYGLSQNDLSNQVTGNTTTYYMSQMCDAPANSSSIWKNPGFIHSTILTGLQPNTQYFYKFGSTLAGWSEVFFFLSPAPQASEAFIVAYGDMGVQVPFSVVNDLQPPSLQTSALVGALVATPGNTSPFSGVSQMYGDSSLPLPWTVLHIGDISYARGYGFLWDYFFDLITPISSQVPYMVCIGNHEQDYTGMPWRANDGYGNDSGGECGIPYDLRFSMPGSVVATRNLWYSFNQGPIHFVFMSSEHDFTQGSTQYQWIANDLASVNKDVTPWIVFSGHRPPYTSSVRSTDEGLMIQETYEPLWIKYKVNLCLWGHVHVYERTCGLQNYTCIDNDAAPVHVIIGMAGNDYQVPWASPDLHSGNGHAAQPEWSIFRTVNYGYSRFFANTSHLNFQFVGDQRGELHDNFWLNLY